MVSLEIINLALADANSAYLKDEVPVAAIVFAHTSQEIIARAHNLSESHNDPTAHAEILVIRNACQKLQSTNLSDYHLFVTLQPCSMCLEAIYLAKISKVFFGAYSDKQQISFYKNVELFGGFGEDRSSKLLKEFFLNKRKP